MKIAKSHISFLDHNQIPNVLTLQFFLDVFLNMRAYVFSPNTCAYGLFPYGIFPCVHTGDIYICYVHILIRYIYTNSCGRKRPRLGTEQLKKTGRRAYGEEGREKKRESNREI